MLCVNCHTSVTDTVAPRIAVKDVTFPSGLKANMGGAGATDDSNVCLLCHQGRESKVSVDLKIATDADGVVSFTNVHYYRSSSIAVWHAGEGRLRVHGQDLCWSEPVQRSWQPV